MSDNIISTRDIMMRVADFSSSPENELISVWTKVVSKIHSNKFESETSERRMPIGERLAGNTRVVDLKNGVLLVETDHSGWIQYLKMYQSFILKGLKMYLPDLKVTSLAFRVSGTNVQLSETYDDQLARERKNYEKKLEMQEKEMEKYNSVNHKENSEINTTLPPEILAKFESIKQSMLTNSKN